MLRRRRQEVAKANALHNAMHMHPQGRNIFAQVSLHAAKLKKLPLR
jgi:hypothetical protein